MGYHFTIIYGSVRSGRQGIKAARFLKKTVEERGHQAALIDPLEYPLPLLEKMYKQYPKGEAPEPMERLAEIFRGTDAFLVVSGEYNHGIPPVLKNLLDHFMNEYFWRPAGIVTYSAGPFGGVRAAMQLRAVLAELGMVTIPSTFPVSKVKEAFDEEGNAIEKAYERRVTRFLTELEWYAGALKTARSGGVPYE